MFRNHKTSYRHAVFCSYLELLMMIEVHKRSASDCLLECDVVVVL
jgi:hypothetical protein